MYYQYGPILLDALTERADRVAVYADDGVQFLGTQWTISIEAVWNPEIIAYYVPPPAPLEGELGGGDATGLPIGPVNRGPGPGLAPGPAGVDIFPIQYGASPILTDNVLRKMLLEPRQRLLIFDRQGQSINEPMHIWVDTGKNDGKPGNLCDPRWGPHPIALNVRQIVGVRSFLVTWQVEFFEAAKPYYTNDPDSLLLSNTHSMTHSLDRDYNIQRDVVGTAVWRADALATLNLNPDGWRPNLLLPIPLGWKRDNVSVRLRDDNQTVDYSFQDNKQPTSVQDIGIGVTRVEGELTEALVRDQDIVSGIIESRRSFLDWKAAQHWANAADQDAQQNNHHAAQQQGHAALGQALLQLLAAQMQNNQKPNPPTP
jgi:hypothetical protein